MPIHEIEYLVESPGGSNYDFNWTIARKYSHVGNIPPAKANFLTQGFTTFAISRQCALSKHGNSFSKMWYLRDWYRLVIEHVTLREGSIKQTPKNF
jgi:hypothetical protein